MAVKLVLSLLLLAATQFCRGEYLDSLEHPEAALIAAMKGVAEALECFSGTTQEGLRRSTQHSDALTQMVLQLKEQVIQYNEKMEAMKVDTFTQEIQDLKQTLEEKQQLEESLVDSIKDLKSEMKRKGTEVQQQEVPVCRDTECEHPQLQEIKKLVQAFNRNRDWAALRIGMEAVLDPSSEEYRQLQSVPYGSTERLWLVGRNGFMQLVSLLLCAGLPADTTDSNGYAVLDGAAQGGHLPLVKLLLDRGAYVHVRSGNGNTPLSGAAASGNLDVVRWLVEAGADPTTRDQNGNSALDWAKGRGHVAVAQYLSQFPH